MDIGYAGAFLGGLAALLSPCAAMLLPSFFAYAFGSSRAKLVGRTGLFYLGLLVTLVPLGLAAGSLGALLAEQRNLLAMIGGIVLLVFGVLQLLGVNLPLPGLRRAGGGTGPLSIVALGAVYGLAGACTGPLLGAVLTVAAVGGSALYGAMLLAMFGAGMVVPLLVLALLWDRFSIGGKLRPRPVTIGPVTTSVWGIVSGLLFIGLGLLFMLTDATGALSGLLDARQQLRIENALQQFSARIPDVAVMAAVAVALAVGVYLRNRMTGAPSQREDQDRSPSR